MAVAREYVDSGKGVCTEAEYFERERKSFGRWEYVDGRIRLMAGGTDDHNMIASNISRSLGNALVPKGCRVYGPDMKVHTGDGVNTFPDVSAVCGERQYYLGRKDVILNPALIVEVLSPSTAEYDEGEKFRHYQTRELLQDYLLVEQEEARVRLFSRRGSHWETREIKGRHGTIHLPSVSVDLALVDVYALIEFED